MIHNIRPAAASDLEELQEIHYETFQCIGQSRTEIQLPKTHEEALFVVEKDGLVIGYASLKETDNNYHCGWYGVRSSLRRTGAGTDLLQYLVEYVRQRSGHSISLDTRNRFKDAIRLYLRHGFDIIGTWVGNDAEIMIKLRIVLNKN